MTDFFNTPKGQYILGLFYARGYLDRKRIRVQVRPEDIELLNIIKDGLGQGKIYRLFNGRFSLTISDSKLVEILIELGCRKTRYCPLYFPKNATWDFIRGFFDGSGAYNTRGKYLTIFITAPQEFIKGFRNFITQYNISSREYFRDESSNSSTISISKTREASSFCYLMYINKQFGYLERKFRKFQEWQQNSV